LRSAVWLSALRRVALMEAGSGSEVRSGFRCK
jgi:hypothetical protein